MLERMLIALRYLKASAGFPATPGPDGRVNGPASPDRGAVRDGRPGPASPRPPAGFVRLLILPRITAIQTCRRRRVTVRELVSVQDNLGDVRGEQDHDCVY